MKPSKPKYGFVRLDRDMYQHHAFLSLSKNAIKTLIAFLDARRFERLPDKSGRITKKCKLVCLNRDSLKIPYGLLEKTYRIPRGRIPAALDELMAKGFIEVKYAGGSAQSDMSIYALTENWRLWIPGAKPFKVREARQHHGYQGQPLGAIAGRQGAKSANIAHKTEPIHTHETEPIPTS